MADNDALTKPPRSRCEAQLAIAEAALKEIVMHNVDFDRGLLWSGRIAKRALDRISTLRKEAGE